MTKSEDEDGRQSKGPLCVSLRMSGTIRRDTQVSTATPTYLLPLVTQTYLSDWTPRW